MTDNDIKKLKQRCSRLEIIADRLEQTISGFRSSADMAEHETYICDQCKANIEETEAGECNYKNCEHGLN